jgi:protein TonB
MFHNLIESQSHRKEFKRRSSFFLFTVAAYAVILFGAGIGSIYAYDAQLEAQANSLEVLEWIPPVTPAPPKPVVEREQTIRRSTPSTAPIDPNLRVQQRTAAYSETANPLMVPREINTKGVDIPPVTNQRFVIGPGNFDPPAATGTDKGSCLTCPGKEPPVNLTEKEPEPMVVKPVTTQHVTSIVLSGKATSLPQPMYPRIAKDAHVQGPVSIQILVNEEGKVMSAQVVSGNPMLISAARDAAMRARFSPTLLNGQPVKIQGVITYNFVLQ